MKARIREANPGRRGLRSAGIRDLLAFFDAFAARSAAGEEEKRLREAAEDKASGNGPALVAQARMQDLSTD